MLKLWHTRMHQMVRKLWKLVELVGCSSQLCLGTERSYCRALGTLGVRNVLFKQTLLLWSCTIRFNFNIPTHILFTLSPEERTESSLPLSCHCLYTYPIQASSAWCLVAQCPSSGRWPRPMHACRQDLRPHGTAKQKKLGGHEI